MKSPFPSNDCRQWIRVGSLARLARTSSFCGGLLVVGLALPRLCAQEVAPPTATEPSGITEPFGSGALTEPIAPVAVPAPGMPMPDPVPLPSDPNALDPYAGDPFAAGTDYSLPEDYAMPDDDGAVALDPISELPTEATGPDFEAPVAMPPSGVLPIPGAEVSQFSHFLKGFSYGIGTSLYYDSNIFQSNGFLRPKEDDIILSLSPYISYQKPGGDFTYGARFALNYLQYFDHSDRGGLGYNFAANVGYTGGKFRFGGTFGSSISNGSNRNYNNAYVQTTTFNTGLSLSYTLSPKTSIDSRFGYNWTNADGSAFSSTNNMNFDVSAMWKLSPLTSIGPGVAWSLQNGTRGPDRTTIGPIIRINYKLAKKLALNGTFGVQFVDTSGLVSLDNTFTARLGVNYQATSLWGLNLSLYKGTQANGGVGSAFRDISSIRLGYHHQIRRARLNMGVSYEISDAPTNIGSLIDPDRNYFNFDASVGMPVFYNRATASLFASWSKETGGRPWDGYRVGMSLSTAF